MPKETFRNLDALLERLSPELRDKFTPLTEELKKLSRSRLSLLRLSRERNARIRTLEHELSRHHRRLYPLNPWGISLSEVDQLVLMNEKLRIQNEKLLDALEAYEGPM